MALDALGFVCTTYEEMRGKNKKPGPFPKPLQKVSSWVDRLAVQKVRFQAMCYATCNALHLSKKSLIDGDSTLGHDIEMYRELLMLLATTLGESIRTSRCSCDSRRDLQEYLSMASRDRFGLHCTRGSLINIHIKSGIFSPRPCSYSIYFSATCEA